MRFRGPLRQRGRHGGKAGGGQRAQSGGEHGLQAVFVPFGQIEVPQVFGELTKVRGVVRQRLSDEFSGAKASEEGLKSQGFVQRRRRRRIQRREELVLGNCILGNGSEIVRDGTWTKTDQRVEEGKEQRMNRGFEMGREREVNKEMTRMRSRERRKGYVEREE